VSALQAQHTTVTIAAVNNPDMIELKKLSSKFEQQNPDVTLQWVIVEENTLRQRVTTDVSTGSGQFDLVLEFPVANGQRPRAWREPLQIDADATMISTLAWFRAWLRSGGGEASLTKMSIASSGAI
jgi:ABC-type glycerol-3-phosphate transport system substrate-binding protein